MVEYYPKSELPAYCGPLWYEKSFTDRPVGWYWKVPDGGNIGPFASEEQAEEVGPIYHSELQESMMLWQARTSV